MSSFFKHRPSGYVVAISAVFVFRWSTILVNGWGYAPYQGIGIAMTLGVMIGFLLALLIIDQILAYSGIEKTVRSGVWFSAMVAPYTGITTMEIAGPVWSQAAGFVSGLLAFAAIYFLDAWLERGKE